MKKKIKIEKGILFILFTILSMILYYRVIPIINRYGTLPFYHKDYTSTDFFGQQIEYILINLESHLDRTEEISEYVRDIVGVSNLEYILDITTVDGYHLNVTNIEMIEDLEEEKEQFVTSNFYYLCSLNSAPETNIGHLQYYRFHADQNKFARLDVYVRVNDFEIKDGLHSYKENYENFSYHAMPLIAICAILALVCVVILIHLTIKEEKNKKKKWDQFYNEELFTITLFVVLFIVAMLWDTGSYFVYMKNIFKYLAYGIGYWMLQQIYFTIIRRVKRKELITNFMVLKISENRKDIYPVIGEMSLLVSILVIITIIGEKSYYSGSVFYSLLLVCIIITLHLLALILEKIKIEKWLEQMVNGNYTEAMEGRTAVFKEMIASLNHVQKGMQSAVEEKIKSQRLKADLITNVSHDLKTPLTAIINYVSLLKKEKIENENAKRYISVLEEKSKKLKNLTEDLIEASKISSGNETVNLERLNFAEMVQQANGEFAAALEEKGLILVSNVQEEEMYTYLDSKKMWRVLENIYGNIVKYALENTRVYVKLQRKENGMELSIKNISKEELDIKPEELMERFVRGDRSRNTSGSGLGLSISRDLVELQNGKFSIFIEGDLFKVMIEVKGEETK